MSRPQPFTVRPRKDSALEEVWDGENHSVSAMREVLHSWADYFKHMVSESEKTEEDDATG